MRAYSDWLYLALWFGAAVSLSEILAGTLLAPLGLVTGLTAIVLGHVIGTTLLVLGGIVGTKTGRSAMGTTEIAFGRVGRRLFAVINIVQLVGWTAIMLKVGAQQFVLIAPVGGAGTLIGVLGALVCVWIGLGRAGVGWLNGTAVALLILLSAGVFGQLLFEPLALAAETTNTMRFGAGLELVVVMPLSWLPLIADYNRHGRSAPRVAAFSWCGYMIGSAWMYAVGLLMALTAGRMDLGLLAGDTGAALPILIVILLSTVTTTFMDAYSAGVSATNVAARLPARPAAAGLTLAAVIIAWLAPMSAYQNFLYTVGALFSPLYAVVLSHFFMCRAPEAGDRPIAWLAVFVWAAGVGTYYEFLALDTPLGATLPAFLGTAIVYWGITRLGAKYKRERGSPCAANLNPRGDAQRKNT